MERQKCMYTYISILYILNSPNIPVKGHFVAPIYSRFIFAQGANDEA